MQKQSGTPAIAEVVAISIKPQRVHIGWKLGVSNLCVGKCV
ncbi:MAG: hypothetical protein ACTSRS_22635 [Candidatus Helarchaeota archaeon]